MNNRIRCNRSIMGPAKRKCKDIGQAHLCFIPFPGKVRLYVKVGQQGFNRLSMFLRVGADSICDYPIIRSHCEPDRPQSSLPHYRCDFILAAHSGHRLGKSIRMDREDRTFILPMVSRYRIHCTLKDRRLSGLVNTSRIIERVPRMISVRRCCRLSHIR